MAAERPTNGNRTTNKGKRTANTRAAVEAEIAAAARNDPITEAILPQEARLLYDRNVLLILGAECPDKQLGENFFGSVIRMDTPETPLDPSALFGKTVYMCGDISWASCDTIGALLGNVKEACIIGPLSTNFESSMVPVVGPGRVPISVHGVGVLYRQFFDINNVFEKVQKEHKFQELADSDKPGSGIYITPITKDTEGDLNFRLLRGSTKLSGPTDNFRKTDHQIVESLNQEAARIFDNPAPLNHALAQVDENEQTTQNRSDKTKDMPTNGIMAFSTFYGQLEDKLKRSSSETDPFDWEGKEGTSGLTRLRFRLKDQVMQRGSPLDGQFYVTLYPNSVFFMPLSTNRLYTHKSSPSALGPGQLPTRLGYIVRCSATEAVHKPAEGKTFIRKRTREEMELEPATDDGAKRLKRLHERQDDSDQFIDYHGLFNADESKERFNINFSTNQGDYVKPNYDIRDEFHIFTLELPTNPFAHLKQSVSFEDTSKGQRAVIVHSDPENGTPIVRTTTIYNTPAQEFQQVHHGLANEIITAASLSMPLNNAMIETRNNQSVEMAFHSCQAQDLAKDSQIALFSCYKHPSITSQKLVVESKTPGEGSFEIPLTHNSVVVWSLETNGRFRHKIEPDRSKAENTWLGFTFRTSSTSVQYRQEEGDSHKRAYFASDTGLLCAGMPLLLLEGDSRSSVYKLRKMENEAMGFEYPSILTSTISPSDLRPPTKKKKAPQLNQNPPAAMEM